jgi:succinate dehydrogenase (ubiquinone) iron-sulfur subunit
MQAYRWIIDSRDQFGKERLEFLEKEIRIDECQNIGMCSATCPKGLNPQGAIQHLMKLIEEQCHVNAEKNVF